MAEIIDLNSYLNSQLEAASKQAEFLSEVNEKTDFSSYILESSRDGILAYDRQFRYTIFNRAMCELSGRTSEEVLGRSTFDVFPFMNEPRRRRLLENALSGMSTTEVHEFFNPVKNIMLTVESIHSPLKDEFGKIVGGLAIVRDKTELKKAVDRISTLNLNLECQIVEKTRTLHFLSSAGDLLASPLDLEETMNRFNALTVELFSGWCVLRVFSEDGKMMTIHHDPDPERSHLTREIDRLYPVMQYGLPREVFESKKGRLVDHTPPEYFGGFARDERHLEMMLKLKVRSYMSVPLMIDGRSLGVLSISTSVRNYSQSDFETAKLLGNMFATSIERNKNRINA